MIRNIMRGLNNRQNKTWVLKKPALNPKRVNPVFNRMKPGTKSQQLMKGMKYPVPRAQGI